MYQVALDAEMCAAARVARAALVAVGPEMSGIARRGLKSAHLYRHRDLGGEPSPERALAELAQAIGREHGPPDTMAGRLALASAAIAETGRRLALATVEASARSTPFRAVERADRVARRFAEVAERLWREARRAAGHDGSAEQQ